MTRRLKVIRIDEGKRDDIGILNAGEAVVGREGESDLVVKSKGVSRRHGLFARVHTHWLFKDLGSTNGTWHNGTPLSPGRWRIVRAGDLIQMAEAAIRLVTIDGDDSEAIHSNLLESEGRSLLIFVAGIIKGDYPIPNSGKALSIGGTKADLKVKGTSALLLSVERHNEFLYALVEHPARVGNFQIVMVNGQAVTGKFPLGDNDEIRCEEYLILVNDPVSDSNNRKNRITRERDVPSLMPHIVPSTNWVKPLQTTPSETETPRAKNRNTLLIDPESLERRGIEIGEGTSAKENFTGTSLRLGSLNSLLILFTLITLLLSIALISGLVFRLSG